MNSISFFKQQAKNFMHDFKTQKIISSNEEGIIYGYSPKFFDDIDDIIVSYAIDEDHFTLMNAQHLIANFAGFDSWSELIHASEAALELGELIFRFRGYQFPQYTILLMMSMLRIRFHSMHLVGNGFFFQII